MLKLLTSIAIAAALAGCAGSNFSYDNARKVEIGMTEAQLVGLMGQPYSVASRGNEQMWIWSHANGFSGSSKAVSFKVIDGKVAEVPKIPESFK